MSKLNRTDTVRQTPGSVCKWGNEIPLIIGEVIMCVDSDGWNDLIRKCLSLLTDSLCINTFPPGKRDVITLEMENSCFFLQMHELCFWKWTLESTYAPWNLKWLERMPENPRNRPKHGEKTNKLLLFRT